MQATAQSASAAARAPPPAPQLPVVVDPKVAINGELDTIELDTIELDTMHASQCPVGVCVCVCVWVWVWVWLFDLKWPHVVCWIP